VTAGVDGLTRGRTPPGRALRLGGARGPHQPAAAGMTEWPELGTRPNSPSASAGAAAGAVAGGFLNVAGLACRLDELGHLALAASSPPGARQGSFPGGIPGARSGDTVSSGGPKTVGMGRHIRQTAFVLAMDPPGPAATARTLGTAAEGMGLCDTSSGPALTPSRTGPDGNSRTVFRSRP